MKGLIGPRRRDRFLTTKAGESVSFLMHSEADTAVGSWDEPHGGHAADHVAEARQRARDVLSCESHLGEVDDWRQATVTARDAVILLWVIWLGLSGFGVREHVGPILVAAGMGIALYLGMAGAVATQVRLRYLERELERERREIQSQPEHEREEVRALYAAKGFREPLLSQITDVLCADDDRLLKVMMEEELGLFIQHMNHPLLVGLWNAAGAAVGALLMAMPVCFQRSESTLVWMPAATAAMLMGVAVATGKLARRPVVPIVATWWFAAGVAGGVTYFLADLLGGGP